MAQVYRGTDTVLNRTVAIKVLGPQYAQDAGFVERFRREAQAAARLNHPNVVSVYDTGSEGPVHYIVMEYVDGKTLAEVLPKATTSSRSGPPRSPRRWPRPCRSPTPRGSSTAT